MTTPAWAKYLGAITAVFLLGFYGFFLFYHLGSRPFIDWDESIYAQVSKEALLNHQPFDFTLYGNHWFEKPPLMLWLTEAGFKVFGINEFGGRFFAALLAFTTIILTCLLAKKLSNSNLAALLTLACFGICYHFFFHGYFLEFDVPVGFFILLSLYAFLQALEKPKYFYLFFASVGLGLLTKNVIGLIPLPIVFTYLLAAGKFKLLNNRHFYYGLILCALVVLPWHIRESVKFGRGFWQVYLLYHVLDRYAQPLENNGGPLNFYITIFWQNPVFLWLCVASGIYFLIKSFKNLGYFFLLFSSLFIFFLFSLAQTKGIGYITVLYPYLLCMFGITLADLFHKAPNLWLKILPIGLLILIFSGLAWQEEWYKILRLEKDPIYLENKDIANFLLNNYPAKPVYAYSYAEANLAFDYYMGRPIPGLPADKILPASINQTPKYRIFHRQNRSVYNLPDYLYIAP